MEELMFNVKFYTKQIQDNAERFYLKVSKLYLLKCSSEEGADTGVHEHQEWGQVHGCELPTLSCFL